MDNPALAVEAGVQEQVAFFGNPSGGTLKAVYRAGDAFCLLARPSCSGS